MNHSDIIFEKIAEEYGKKNQKEIMNINPWKSVLRMFLVGFLLSLFRVMDIKEVTVITSQIGIALMIFSLGQLQKENKAFRWSFSFAWGLQMYHLLMPFIYKEDIMANVVVLVIEVVLRGIVLFCLCCGIENLSVEIKQKAAIQKYADYLLGAYVYFCVIPILSVITGYGEYGIDENIINIGWILLEILAVVLFIWSLMKIVRELRDMGYGLQPLSVEKMQLLKWIVLVISILKIGIHFFL